MKDPVCPKCQTSKVGYVDVSKFECRLCQHQFDAVGDWEGKGSKPAKEILPDEQLLLAESGNAGCPYCGGCWHGGLRR